MIWISCEAGRRGLRRFACAALAVLLVAGCNLARAGTAYWRVTIDRVTVVADSSEQRCSKLAAQVLAWWNSTLWRPTRCCRWSLLAILVTGRRGRRKPRESGRVAAPQPSAVVQPCFSSVLPGLPAAPFAPLRSRTTLANRTSTRVPPLPRLPPATISGTSFTPALASACATCTRA